MLLIKIFSVFLPIIIGILIRKKGIISSTTIKEISVLITKVFYPALILASFLRNFNSSDLSRDFLLPVGTILIMVCGYIVGFMFSKFLSFKSEKEKNVFHFQCTINNYSFLPLPIILFIYGEKYVPMLILSTFGSEISVWTIGILALTGNKFEKKSLKNLLSIPMISILIAIILIFLKGFVIIENKMLIEIGNSILNFLNLMGNATVPMALFIAGAKMGEVELKNILQFNHLLLSFIRLIFIPLISILLFNLFPFSSDVKKVLSVVAIMPTAIASIVLSSAFESDSEFAAETVLLTHLFSLITIPFFLYFFQ